MKNSISTPLFMLRAYDIESLAPQAPSGFKFFSTRIIIVVFSFHFLMSKIELFGNLGRVFCEISAHKYQQPSILLRIMPASHPVSGCILSATLLCKKPGQVTPLPENLCWYTVFSIVFIGCCPHTGISRSFTPPYLHGEKRRFWKHLREHLLRNGYSLFGGKRKAPA